MCQSSSLKEIKAQGFVLKFVRKDGAICRQSPTLEHFTLNMSFQGARTISTDVAKHFTKCDGT